MALPSEIATTGHERSKTLINFSLPNLWGTQRHLRCVKNDSITGEKRRFRFRSSELNNRKVESLEEEEGIEEFREKIMLDLKTVADKMTESIIRKQYNEEEEEGVEEKPPEKEVSPTESPWNLRKRRAACKAPIEGNDLKKGLGIEEKEKEKKRVMIKESVKKSSKLVYTLTKKEIEDDYMNMFGHRPPRRPKKRSRNVQKHIDLLNPASYITEITEDLYEVSDAVAANGKR